MRGLLFHGYHGVLPEVRIIARALGLCGRPAVAPPPLLHQHPPPPPHRSTKPATPATPQENTLGQKFLVDATLYCGPQGLAAAGRSDDLSDSVNYAAVYEGVRETMEGPPFKLLEAAAAAICARVLAEQRGVAAVRVHVRKPHVALRGPLESVGVEIFRSRGDC